MMKVVYFIFPRKLLEWSGRGQVVMYLACDQGALGSIPSFAKSICDTGYILLPSRDTIESDVNPNNNPIQLTKGSEI